MIWTPTKLAGGAKTQGRTDASRPATKTAGRGASGRLIKTQGRTDASRPPYKNTAHKAALIVNPLGDTVVIWVTN